MADKNVVQLRDKKIKELLENLESAWNRIDRLENDLAYLRDVYRDALAEIKMLVEKR